MDKEEISYQCLTNEQLVDKTAGLLRILELRLERKQSLCSQTVQNLMSETEKLKTVNSIIDQLQGLVLSGSAQGFVFGLITENKIWSASSDNLSSWWTKSVNFKQNGPSVLASETCESLGLDALKDLKDPTLSSIVSVLMPHCWPAQRAAPFYGEIPVAWWPKGTEEWWGRVNILKDSGPPEYKKPHNLRKNAKIAVLIAIIKNLEPNFSKIRSLVSDSETLQSKMEKREKNIWLAVLRGEEMRNPDYPRWSSANILGNSGIESNICYIAGKNVEVEKVGDGGVVDKLVNIINSSLLEKVENTGENKKKITAGKKQVIVTESSRSTRSQDLISKATNVNEPGEMDDREYPNEEFIAHAEQVQVSEKNSPASSQMKKDTASKSKNTKKRKLMGIVNPDPKRLKLPYWNRALRWRSHDIQGPLSESTGSFHEITRTKKSNEIMNTGTLANNIANKYNNYSWKSSYCDYTGMVNDPHQEYQVQTNNFGASSSKNRTSQSYDSPASLLDLALIQGQVNTLSSNSLVPHDQSMNRYTIEKGSVNIDNQIQHYSQPIYGTPNFTSLSKIDDHPTVENSSRPNTNENNKMERSDLNEHGAVDKSLHSTLMQDSVDYKNHEFQTYNSTFNPRSISANDFNLGKNITYQPIASYSVRARSQNATNSDSVKSLNHSITANQSSTNLNPQLQHQLLLNSAKHGSVYINPQFQDQLKLFSKKQGLRDRETQFQNQFESGSSKDPILDSSHSQITKGEWVSNSLIPTEHGINYGEDLDSGTNNDAEKTMVVENSDAAAESGLQNLEFDDLAVELNAFCALDSFDSNNLDGIF